MYVSSISQKIQHIKRNLIGCLRRLVESTRCTTPQFRFEWRIKSFGWGWLTKRIIFTLITSTLLWQNAAVRWRTLHRILRVASKCVLVLKHSHTFESRVSNRSASHLFNKLSSSTINLLPYLICSKFKHQLSIHHASSQNAPDETASHCASNSASIATIRFNPLRTVASAASRPVGLQTCRCRRGSYSQREPRFFGWKPVDI